MLLRTAKARQQRAHSQFLVYRSNLIGLFYACKGILMSLTEYISLLFLQALSHKILPLRQINRAMNIFYRFLICTLYYSYNFAPNWIAQRKDIFNHGKDFDATLKPPKFSKFGCFKLQVFRLVCAFIHNQRNYRS